MNTRFDQFADARIPSGAVRRSRFYQKLYVQVIIAVIIGALVGYFYPHLGTLLKPYGDAFVRAIRVVVAPIIFTTIVVGIAKMGDMKRVANVGIKALIYFEVASTIALIIGMIVGNYWKVGAGINAHPSAFDIKTVEAYAKSAQDMTITDFFLGIIPNSFAEAFVKADILPILFIALLLGLALTMVGDRGKPLVTVLEAASEALFGMVRVIMYCAPIAAACAMAFTVGKYGLSTLVSLGELVLSVYLVSAIFVIVVFGGFLRLCGYRIMQVLSYFKDEIIFVFAATSAETMMPKSMQKLEKLGISREVVGLVMPGGFSFNMDGTAIYMTMSVLFLAHAFNIDLSLTQQLTVLFVMLFTSKGAAGVTGGGFIALAATLPAIDAVPIAGLALLLGVDRFMAEIRAATNLTSNIVATIVVGKWVNAIDDFKARTELEKGYVEEIKVAH
jgi:aerobic C4-dicarboxylate transport protein